MFILFDKTKKCYLLFNDKAIRTAFILARTAFEFERYLVSLGNTWPKLWVWKVFLEPASLIKP